MNPAAPICPVCPLCRSVDCILLLRSHRLDGPLHRCAGCRLHFVDQRELAGPACGVAQEMERLSTRAGQLRLVERHVEEAETPWRETMARERLADLRRFVDRGRLLEIGCSTGEFLRAAADYFEVCGVEADQHAARIAAAKGLDCRPGELAAAGLAPGSIDVAALYHVIEHLRDPRQELRELRRLLRPGGHLVIETPDIETIWFRLLGARWRQIIPDHLLFFSRATLTRLLGEEGFTVTEIRHVGKSMSLRLFVSRIGRYSKALAHLCGLLLRLLRLEDKTLRLNLHDVIRLQAVKSSPAGLSD